MAPVLPKLSGTLSPDPTMSLPENTTEVVVKIEARQETPRFHSSLSRSLEAPLGPSLEEMKDGLITKTSGLSLQAEKVWRRSREVYNSPLKMSQCSAGLPRERVRTDTKKQICCHSNCRFLHLQEHRDKFAHVCPEGDKCNQYLCGDPEHCSNFVHPRRDALQDDGAGQPLLPNLAAARLQTLQPVPSTCPRGGYRPQGGTWLPIELSEGVRRSNRTDEVAMVVNGLNIYWNERDLAHFLQRMLGPKVKPIRLQMSTAGQSIRAAASAAAVAAAGPGATGPAVHFSNSAIVFLENHAEALMLKQILDGRMMDGFECPLLVEYLEPIERPYDKYIPDPRMRLRGQPPDPAGLRYRRRIHECGPYLADARAVLERMRLDGHPPDAAAYTALLRCCRGACACARS